MLLPVGLLVSSHSKGCHYITPFNRTSITWYLQAEVEQRSILQLKEVVQGVAMPDYVILRNCLFHPGHLHRRAPPMAALNRAIQVFLQYVTPFSGT